MVSLMEFAIKRSLITDTKIAINANITGLEVDQDWYGKAAMNTTVMMKVAHRETSLT